MFNDIKAYGFEEDYYWLEYKSTGRVAIKRKGKIFFEHYNSLDEFQKAQKVKSVVVSIDKVPKGKIQDKVKIEGVTYSIKQDKQNLYVYLSKDFNKKLGKTVGVIQSFNKAKIGSMDYTNFERDYIEALIEFNKGWFHGDYVTSCIAQKIYELIIKGE